MGRDLPDLSETTTFDGRLCEVPAQRDVIEHAVAHSSALLQEARRDGDANSILRLLGYRGDACRVLGRAEEAVALLTETVERTEGSGNRRSSLANRLRLAEARKYHGDLNGAETLFRHLQDAQDPDLVQYRDFALQHFAKCCLEMGNVTVATMLLEQALTIRRQKGDERLIASTELALRHARAWTAATSVE